MSEELTKGPGARKKDIDWKEVGKMLEAKCKTASIAKKYGLHPDTIRNRCKSDLGMEFSEFRQQNEATGEDNLRVKMYRMAVDQGNVALLIWLSKQWLGMTDKQVVENSHEVFEVIIGQPVSHRDRGAIASPARVLDEPGTA